jgi:hypothetical protein
MIFTYLEVCKGKLHLEWKFKPVNFWCWQDILSQQMMRYQPNHHAYAGDEGATSAIKQNTEKHHHTTLSLSSSSASTALSTGVSTEKFLLAQGSWLCGDLTELTKHYNSSFLSGPPSQEHECVCLL